MKTGTATEYGGRKYGIGKSGIALREPRRALGRIRIPIFDSSFDRPSFSLAPVHRRTPESIANCRYAVRDPKGAVIDT